MRMLVTVLELVLIITVIMVAAKELIIPLWNNTPIFPSLRNLLTSLEKDE